ncbi:MAG TPA: RNA methyltransferase, partial [Vicinamibacterales bacterium]|nr:RNA methyltransferase [Vicinamibacterales bacterium]
MLEGKRAVADALEADVAVREIFVADDIELDGDWGVPVHRIGGRVVRALSDAVTPQGIVAVADIPSASLDDVATSDLTLILDGIADPGNAGTLIRTAAAAGVGAVVFTTGSVDPFSPKCVRAAAGSLFATKIVIDVALENVVDVARSADAKVIATAMGGAPYHESDLTGKLAIVAGNEAWGVDKTHVALCDEVIGIPIVGRVESLNVAIATGIVLFEALRQRRLSSGTGR